jgi:hypothetical protein
VKNHENLSSYRDCIWDVINEWLRRSSLVRGERVWCFKKVTLRSPKERPEWFNSEKFSYDSFTAALSFSVGQLLQRCLQGRKST